MLVDSRYAAIFEQSPLAILAVDMTTGLTIAANPRAAELFAIPREQLLGRDTRSLGLTSHTSRDLIAAQLAAGQVVRDAEASVLAANGQRRFVRYTCELVQGDGGPVLLSMMLDVTDRLRAERRLDVQLKVAGILSTSRTIEAAAPLLLAEMCATQRWTNGEIHVKDFVTGGLRQLATYGVFVPNTPGSMRVPFPEGEQTLGYVDLAGDLREPIDDQLRAVVAGIGQQVGQFITRSRTAREIERSEMRLSAVMESMSEGLTVATLDGRLVHWNLAALELHGFRTSADWENSLASFTSIMELSTLDGTVVPFEEWPMARIVRGEKLRNLELRLRRTDIAWTRVFRYGGSLVELADGSRIILLTMADMTDRVQVAEELRAMNDSLEQRVDERTASLSAANSELEAFTYSVSHDLRAPLRAIRGFAGILDQDYADGLPEQARAYLATILSRGARMAELLEDLLTLSKVVRRPMSRRVIDITALAREAIAEVVMPGSPCEIVIEELPATSADASLVQQVFVNLVGNAVKFSRDREPPRITIGSVPSSPPTYFVRDNGVGFAEDDAPRLFVPFQRLHEGQAFEGSGVGLAIVQRVIARHGGRVWAEGEVGRGATFYFTLVGVLTAPLTGIPSSVPPAVPGSGGGIVLPATG